MLLELPLLGWVLSSREGWWRATRFLKDKLRFFLCFFELELVVDFVSSDGVVSSGISDKCGKVSYCVKGLKMSFRNSNDFCELISSGACLLPPPLPRLRLLLGVALLSSAETFSASTCLNTSSSKPQYPPLPGISAGLGTLTKTGFRDRLCRIEFCHATSALS